MKNKFKFTVRLIQFLAIIPLIVSIYLFIDEHKSTDEIFKWFILTILLISVDFLQGIFTRLKTIKVNGIGELNIYDLERNNVDLTPLAEQYGGRRFANLIYIISKNTLKMAMAIQGEYNYYLPPGRRLSVFEMPHSDIVKIVRDQLGINILYENIFSQKSIEKFDVFDKNGSKSGETEICISPLWVQLEKHAHRSENGLSINEHFDFIYLILVDDELSFGPASRKNPEWFSLEEVGNMINPESPKKTFIDVYYGFKSILKIIEKKDHLKY